MVAAKKHVPIVKKRTFPIADRFHSPKPPLLAWIATPFDRPVPGEEFGNEEELENPS